MPEPGIERSYEMPRERVAPIISDLNGHIRQLVYKKRLIAQQEAERREMLAKQAAPAVQQPSMENGSTDAFAVLDLMDPDNYFAKLQRMEMQQENKHAAQETMVPASEEPDLPIEEQVHSETMTDRYSRDDKQSKETGREGPVPDGKGKGRPSVQTVRSSGKNERSAAPPSRDSLPGKKRDAAFRGEIREDVLERERQLKRDKEMEVHELHRPLPDEMLSKAVSPQAAVRMDEKSTEDLVRKAVTRSAVRETLQPSTPAPYVERERAETEHAMNAQDQMREAGSRVKDPRQQQDLRGRTAAARSHDISADGIGRRDFNTIVERAMNRREADSVMRQAALFTHTFNRPVMFRDGKDTLVFVKEGKENQAETFAVINGRKVSDREATRFMTNINEVLKIQGIRQGINILADRLSIAEKNPYQGASKDLLPKAIAPAMEKERSIAVERK